jgi:hypothetical protein
VTRFRWLLATSLRGLRARWVLSLGSLLLTVIAIASAVVGPSYQQTAANSFVIAQLRAQPSINTGLTYDYKPAANEDVDAAIASALDATTRESGRGYLPGHPIVWQQLPQADLKNGSGAPSVPRLVSVPGACDHVHLVGRCPTNPDEIAMLRVDADNNGLKVGDTFNPYDARTPFRVVGIYTASDSAADDAFWGGSGRLQSTTGALLPRVVPAHPGPWITTQAGIELRPQSWFVTVDQRLATPPDMTAQDLEAVAARVKAINNADEHGELLSGLSLEAGNTLPDTAAQLINRRGVTRSTVQPAVLSLILVALVLLSRLLAASMTLRRGELALASLRG